MKEKIINVLYALFLPIVIILLWQIFSSLGVINKSILPAPSKVVEALEGLIKKGTYSKHIIASFSRVIKGYILGTFLGLTLGALIGLSKRLDRLTRSLIGIFRPIPAIACIPFFILMFGIGEESKVAVIVLGSFWPVLLNTIQGIQNTDLKLLEVGEVFKKNKLTVLLKIIIPSALPFIFAGLRLGIGGSWTAVVAAEMIAASSGIGYLISYGRELAQPALLVVGIITMGIIGLIIDTLMLYLQKKAIYWKA